MTYLPHLERSIIRVSRMIGLVGLIGLLVLAFATVLDVFLRWIFNSPITGVRDAGALLVAVAVAASFSVCIAERGNITIRFIGNLLGQRWRDSLDIFGNMVMLGFFALMVRQLWLYADELALNHDTTMVLGWPVAPWWRVVVILVAFCVPVQIVVIFQMAKSAIAGNSSTEGEPLSGLDATQGER